MVAATDAAVWTVLLHLDICSWNTQQGRALKIFFFFEHPDAFNNGWVKQTPAAPRSRPHCYQRVTWEWRNLSGLFWMWAHLNTFRLPPNFSSWLFRGGRATQVGLCLPCEVKHLQVNFDAWLHLMSLESIIYFLLSSFISTMYALTGCGESAFISLLFSFIFILSPQQAEIRRRFLAFPEFFILLFRNMTKQNARRLLPRRSFIRFYSKILLTGLASANTWEQKCRGCDLDGFIYHADI